MNLDSVVCRGKQIMGTNASSVARVTAVLGSLAVVLRASTLLLRDRNKTGRDAKAAVSSGESARIALTDGPCIVQMQALLKGTKDVLSLSQGIVHWKPPPAALKAASEAVLNDPKIHSYGPDGGSAELINALKAKLRSENGIENSEVMVTCGANQAFMNAVIALCDSDSPVVLFPPYYFNHHMAIQMTGGSASLEYGDVDEKLLPSIEWLRSRFAESKRGGIGARQAPRVVVLCNPSNPTGVVVPPKLLRDIKELCERNDCWLVADNTYEYFMYGGAKHATVEGPRVVNIFSFSKAYGMMGWRVGYLAYPPALSAALLKTQDTIPICPPQLSQRVALGALAAGRDWVQDRVRTIEAGQAAVCRALSPLRVCGGQGAIYVFAQLPEPYARRDVDVVRWAVRRHKIALIPGTSCGAPGWVRVSYANIAGEAMQRAASRLRAAVKELTAGVAAGKDVVSEFFQSEKM